MVWVYDTPFTKREEAAYAVLKKRFKNYDLAKETVKLLSLTSFLRSQKFKSVSEVQKSAFYDKAKTRPIFNEKTAKQVLKGLKKRGGADSKYPFIDFTVKNNVSTLVSYLPDFLEYPVRNIYGLLTTPVSSIKENVPLIDLALDAIHGATETGVTTAADAAEAVGGPFGAAIATPFVALAGAAASTVAMLEQDTGQAVAHMVNVVPLFGSALGKGLTQAEHMVKSLESHPGVASYVPLVNTYVSSKAPVIAGNRFSTQKHKHTKWQRTRRNKSART
jgi:hypothetical protein